MRISNEIALTWSIDPSRHSQYFEGPCLNIGSKLPHCPYQGATWSQTMGITLRGNNFSHTKFPLTFLPSEPPTPFVNITDSTNEPHGFHALSKQNGLYGDGLLFFFKYCNEKCLFQIADRAVTSLTVDFPREDVMDFTYPFFFDYTVGIYRKSSPSKVLILCFQVEKIL